MSDSFFSITVVGRRRRLDVSVPADVSVAELLGELVVMLDEQVAGPPPSWGLVRVGGQVLDGERDLAAQGVGAGDLVFLRDLSRPVAPPAVDDYAGAVAAVIDAAPGQWKPAHLQGLLVLAGASWLAGFGVLALLDAMRGVVDAAALFLLAASVAVAAAAVAGRLFRFPLSGATLALAALPMWGAAGVAYARLAGLPDVAALAVGLTAVAAGALGARLAASEATAPAATVLAATLPGALMLAACAWRGAGLATGAVVLVPATLAGIRLLPWAVARLSGLESERDPDTVEARATGARRLLGALTAGAAATLAGGCVILVTDRSGWAHAVALAAALAALLQARRGRFIVDVAPMVLVAVVVLTAFELPYAAAALRRPDQLTGPAVLLGTAAGLAALGLLGRHWRPPVGVRRQLGRAEALAAAATVPLALGMLGLYAAVQAFASRFV